jgi:hypothetical protein
MVNGVWLVVKAAFSEWTTETLVEEERQKSDLETFAGRLACMWNR